MTREAWIVVDLGFGDAGKGSIVDCLVRRRGAGLVVRFNGGAQAGHNVVTPGGRHHTFSQFGAGSFVPGVRTLLGPEFVLHPGGMLEEERHLRAVGVGDGFQRAAVDGRALVVTPFQQAAGRLRELRRGDAAHGSCGLGIGEAVEDALGGRQDLIRAGELTQAPLLREKLAAQQARQRRRLGRPRAGDGGGLEWELLADRGAVGRTMALWRRLVERLEICSPEQTAAQIREAETVVCEGAQGILLDQDHGFHPHTTWSDCTPAGALSMLAGCGARIHRLGVTRAYSIRHGAGPMPTADPEYDRALPEPHNDDLGWQGAVRRGALDLVLLRHGVAAAGGLDGVALTCMDRLPRRLSVAVEYEPMAAAPGLAFDGGAPVRRLPAPPPHDLAARAELTRRLAKARAWLEAVDAGELAARLELELGLPVWLESHGPTWRDKRIVWPRGSAGEPLACSCPRASNTI